MEITTGEKILDAALASFAENGYQGTNLRDLAAGMGLSKSALYRHYAGKEAIWNAVLDRMEAYYAERFGSAQNPPAVPGDCAQLKALTLRMLAFTMHDERVILSRKLLLREQFREERVRRLATAHFQTDVAALFAGLFAGMMENGSLRQDDPAMLAFAYTAPITALVHLRDREPEREPEILQRVQAFIDHFTQTYGGKR